MAKETLSEEDKALLTPEELAHIDDDQGPEVDHIDELPAAERELAEAAAKGIADPAAKAILDAAKAAEAAGGDDDAAKAAAEAKRLADEKAAADKAIADKAAADKLAEDKVKAAAGDETAKAAVDAAEKLIADQRAADEAARRKAVDDEVGELTAPRVRNPKVVREELTKVRSDLRDIRRKFDDGELTAVEWTALEDPLAEKQIDLGVELGSAQAAEERWGITCREFFKDHPEYNSSSDLFTLLDSRVRTEQAAHPLQQYDKRHLVKAHKELNAKLRADLGLPAQAPGTRPAASSAKPGQREIPPTLRNLPADDIIDTDQNPYARIDSLKGTEYEDALAKMTDDQRDAYLSR